VASAPAAGNFAARILQHFTSKPLLLYRAVQASLAGCFVVHVAARLLPSAALARYPDLASMLFVLYAAVQFALLYVILLLQQWALPREGIEDEDLEPLMADAAALAPGSSTGKGASVSAVSAANGSGAVRSAATPVKAATAATAAASSTLSSVRRRK